MDLKIMLKNFTQKRFKNILGMLFFLCLSLGFSGNSLGFFFKTNIKPSKKLQQKSGEEKKIIMKLFQIFF